MGDEELYTLVEIADLMGIPSTTTRYRARLFQDFLHPLRRPKQFRGVRYPAGDLPVFQLINRLYHEERSTGDIRRALEEAREGKVIDAEMPQDDRVSSSVPSVGGNGAETVARIIREGIAQAMAPMADSNRKIADSLEHLQGILAGGGAGVDPDVERRLEELESQGRDDGDAARLRERVRALEDENRRLRQELEEARRSLARRLVRRAIDMF
jgi:DNA-binding transcriptional MerR regulator